MNRQYFHALLILFSGSLLALVGCDSRNEDIAAENDTSSEIAEVAENDGSSKTALLRFGILRKLAR
jgi:hypothetical protein